jgi:phenylalanyl-tRNA synthetase alpha chain
MSLWVLKMEEIERVALEEIEKAQTPEELREIEVKYLGKKGKITEQLKGLGALEPEKRRERGMALNRAKQVIMEALERRSKRIVELQALREAKIDPTLPGIKPQVGHIHPLSLVLEEVMDIFHRLGYYVMDFYEVETEYYNFEALNIPKDHPARDLQDTFYLEDGFLLRTHTSAGQTRAMRLLPPPFRAVFPGKVFRFEATDASHEHTFHQLEGLMIDRHVSVAHLLSAMMTLLTAIFGKDVGVRLRPGYFPFVEPGFELDIHCSVCEGRGCSVCKHSGFVEFLGCGLVHPNVIRAGGLDPREWEGWAFGIGLSRLVMMRYKVSDIRWLLSGDLRFVRQF